MWRIVCCDEADFCASGSKVTGRAPKPDRPHQTQHVLQHRGGEERLFGHDKANTHKGVNPDRKSLSSRLGFVQMAGTCPT